MHEKWLSLFKPPIEVYGYVNNVFDYMSSDSFGISHFLFSQDGIGFLREAWAGAVFGVVRGAIGIKVGDDKNSAPDFLLKFEDRDELWEQVEVLQVQRRRGDEYKQSVWLAKDGKPTLQHDSIEEWHRRADQTPEVISDRCKKKAKKARDVYKIRMNLLVYLNIGVYGIRQQEIEQSFISSSEPAKDAFDEIWILWNNNAYRTWKNGEQAWMKLLGSQD